MSAPRLAGGAIAYGGTLREEPGLFTTCCYRSARGPTALIQHGRACRRLCTRPRTPGGAAAQGFVVKADGACRINALKAAGEQSGEVAGRQSLMTTYTCICRYPPGSAWERQRALRASSLTALFCFSLSRGAVFSSSLSILRLRFEEERATGNKAISIVYGVVDYSSMRSRFATAVGTLEPEEGRGAQAGQPKVELFRNTGLQAFNIYRTP